MQSAYFSGLVEYLEKKQEVREVQVRPGKPASPSDISSWEKQCGCILPEEVKAFYLSHNGFQLNWSCLHRGGVVEIGRIHIASLSELHPLLSQPQSSGSHSVFDLEFDSFTFGDYDWVPSLLLSTDSDHSVLLLDYCNSCGHTCLVLPFTSSTDALTHSGEGKKCGVWLLDLGLVWHKLSSSFSDYLRLTTVHLGLIQWPYALTPNCLSPQYEYWFHIFAPHRLEVDMAKIQSSTTEQSSQQCSGRKTRAWKGGGGGGGRREEEVGGRGGEIDPKLPVDISKILLQAKPSKDKGGSGRGGLRQPAQSSAPRNYRSSSSSSSASKTN